MINWFLKTMGGVGASYPPMWKGAPTVMVVAHTGRDTCASCLAGTDDRKVGPTQSGRSDSEPPQGATPVVVTKQIGWSAVFPPPRGMRPSHIYTLLLSAGLCWATELPAQSVSLDMAYTIDSLRCSGDQDAAIVFAVTGGSPPYQYAWRRQSNAFIFASGTQSAGASTTLDDLAANTYLVRITDATAATYEAAVTIADPPPIFVTDIAVQDATCATDCNGQVRMTLAGGTGTLTVAWPNEGILGADRDNLCEGEYLFTATDARGCLAKGLIEILGATPIVLSAQVMPPACAGNADGSLLVTATGGAGEYRYTWANGATTASLTNLSAGTYPLTVTDAADCPAITVLTVPPGPTLQPNVQINYGCGDGRIQVSALPINGQPPYQYEWSSGEQTPVLTGRSAGNYSLRLRDGRGCEAESAFAIAFVSPLTIDVDVQDVRCPQAADGQITLDVSGGLPPYQITWSNGATGRMLDNLSGGEYLFQLVAGGCGVAQSVWLTEPAALRATIVFAPDADDRLAALAIGTGGTPPYQYRWSNGTIGASTTELLPNTSYTLTITDVRGCQAVQSVLATLTHADEAADADKNVRVFPNPSTDGLFTVDIPMGDIRSIPYRVLDMGGRVCATGTLDAVHRHIDLRGQSAGVYVLQWSAQQGDLQVWRLVVL